jgi:hypothetical protein
MFNQKRYLKNSLAFLLLLVLGTVSIQTNAEQRLLYPQEKALNSIHNKVSAMVKKFTLYKTQMEEKTYLVKPEPGLGIMGEIDAVYKEYEKAKLPQDNTKVKNVKSWMDALKKNTPILEKSYLEGYQNAQGQAKKADTANFPGYDQDVARLKEMYKAYKDPRSVFANPAKAMTVVPKFNDEYAFYKNLPQKYALPLKANKANSLQTWLRTNDRYLDKFNAYQDDYANKLPSLFDSELGKAVQMAEKARADNKPAFFKGGVAQRLQRASDLLSVLEAIKGETSPQVVSLTNKYQQEKKKIDAVETAMASELLASVLAPTDNYSGSDKSTLRGMIETEWKRVYPNDTIMAIRFPANDWKRTTAWKWNNAGWYKVDTSALLAKVVVKTDATIATTYPAYINKNHLKSDALTVGAQTKSHGYIIEKMLVKNFR